MEKITFRLPEDCMKFIERKKKEYSCTTTTVLLMAIRMWKNEVEHEDWLQNNEWYKKRQEVHSENLIIDPEWERPFNINK